MKFAKFLKTPSFTKHLRWILLSNPKSNVKLWKILRYYGNSPFEWSDDGERSLTNPPQTKFFQKLKWRRAHIFAVRWQHSCITLVVLTFNQCKVANWQIHQIVTSSIFRIWNQHRYCFQRRPFGDRKFSNSSLQMKVNRRN